MTRPLSPRRSLSYKRCPRNLNTNLVDNGLRQNLVEERRNISEEKIVIYKGLLSDARDVDYATAVTQLIFRYVGVRSGAKYFCQGLSTLDIEFHQVVLNGNYDKQQQ